MPFDFMNKHCPVVLIILYLVALKYPMGMILGEAPLPFREEDEANDLLSWKKDAAESALRIGLSSVAASLYDQLLSFETTKENQNREELLLGLVTAQLANGHFDNAAKVMQQLSKSNSPRVCIRRSILAFQQNNSTKVAESLEGVEIEDLPPEERGWFHLLKGIGALLGKERELAQNHFETALQIAVSETQKTEFLLLRHRAEISSGKPDEVLAVKLKQQWEKFKGQAAGYDFALEYASVLQSLNRTREAIAVIDAQLKVIPAQNGDKKAHLLLALGLLDQDPNSNLGRDALSSLVEKTETPALAKVGLRILASRFDPLKDDGTYVAFIDRLLSSTKPHLLRENLLLLRANAALAYGADKDADEYCARLMQEYPASPWKLDALKTMATIAWRTQPPRYRKAADYLSQIRSAEEEAGLDYNKTALLMADCHFLANDFENASSAYQNLLKQSFSPDVRAKALFQFVQSQIGLGNLDQAAATLDDKQFDFKKLSSWWQAEWNLIAALKERDGAATAHARVDDTLKTITDNVPEAVKIRLMWLQAQLSLDLNENLNSTPDLTDKIMSMLENSSKLDKAEIAMLRAQTMLTKGQGLLRLQRADESFVVFEKLRSSYPNSEQAVLSYLLEANHHSAQNHLAEAQRKLVTLAERFPKSEYAPRALYEASINAERRGLPESLLEAFGLLKKMTNSFPDSDLLFYARLRQGNLLRNLNDFGAALEIYDEILKNEIFGQHEQRPLAALAKADCLYAMAKSDSAKFGDVALRYSDLYTLGSLPVDLRIEAGYKRALCFRKALKIDEAQAACWEVIQLFVQSDDFFNALGGKGRYWASKTILELGDMLEQQGSSNQAIKVYDLILKRNLPGKALANSRAGTKKE